MIRFEGTSKLQAVIRSAVERAEASEQENKKLQGELASCHRTLEVITCDLAYLRDMSRNAKYTSKIQPGFT